MTKQPRGAAAETSDSSLEVTSCQCPGTSVAKRYETIRQEAHVFPESRGGKRALKGWNRHALPALCDFRHGIQSLLKCQIILKEHVLFLWFFWKGRGLIRGWEHCLEGPCPRWVHSAVLFITDCSGLTPNMGTTGESRTNRCIHPCSLSTSSTSSGYSAKGLFTSAERSWPNAQSRNKGPWPSFVFTQEMPHWTHPAWGPQHPTPLPQPVPKQETATEGPRQPQICVRVIWRDPALKAISYSENHLSWTICRKQSHFKPFPGREELTTALSNLQHGHWESFTFPSPSPGLDACRREKEWESHRLWGNPLTL